MRLQLVGVQRHGQPRGLLRWLVLACNKQKATAK
jgi:hypothetical protein